MNSTYDLENPVSEAETASLCGMHVQGLSALGLGIRLESGLVRYGAARMLDHSTAATARRWCSAEDHNTAIARWNGIDWLGANQRQI